MKKLLKWFRKRNKADNNIPSGDIYSDSFPEDQLDIRQSHPEHCKGWVNDHPGLHRIESKK